MIGGTATPGTILSYGLQFHTLLQTFIKTTGRTLFARGNAHGTGPTPNTDIVLAILDGTLEEAFTGFTGENAIMEAGNFIATNGAR